MKPALPVAAAIGGLVFRKLRQRRRSKASQNEKSKRREALEAILQARRCARWWQSRRTSLQKRLAAFCRKQQRAQMVKEAAKLQKDMAYMTCAAARQQRHLQEALPNICRALGLMTATTFDSWKKQAVLQAASCQVESCKQKCQDLQQALNSANTINDAHVRNKLQQADLVEGLREQVQALQGKVSLRMDEVAVAHQQLSALKQQVMWLRNHNGGTSVAAEEVADDSNQSIRQEGLKPAAKDRWAESMVPLTRVDLKAFQVTASDDPATLSGDLPPRAQAGSGSPRAAGPDQGQIKAYSPGVQGNLVSKKQGEQAGAEAVAAVRDQVEEAAQRRPCPLQDVHSSLTQVDESPESRLEADDETQPMAALHQAHPSAVPQEEVGSAEEASQGQAKHGNPTAPLQQETPGRDNDTLPVTWMPSHNGGTSAAADEAQDSSPSIRQEGLKPAAKDPWAAVMKNMVPLTRVDPKDFQVTACDDPATLSGDLPPRAQAGSGSPRAAGPDQGQIKAFSPAEPRVGVEMRFPVEEFVRNHKKEHAALYKCRPAQCSIAAHQFPCKVCVQPHHGLTRLFRQGYFGEEPKVPNPSPEVEGDAIIPLGTVTDRIGIRVGKWGVVNAQNMTGIMQMIHDSHGEHAAKRVRRPLLKCSLVVTEQDGQETVALTLRETPPRQMVLSLDAPTYDSDEVAMIEKDKTSLDLQLLRAAQVLPVLRNLVEWAADGGDLMLKGMGNLPLTPERMLKHIALVVSGEAEVRALLDAGIKEDPRLWDGDEKVPDLNKLQDVICPSCQYACGGQEKPTVACFFCPTCATLRDHSGYFPLCVRCAHDSVTRGTRCPKGHDFAMMKQLAGARRIPTNLYRHPES